jgi:hypothetical protein
MKCVYFDGTKCRIKVVSSPIFDYTPNKKEKEDYCENLKFSTCPRYDAILDFLRAGQKV